MGETMISVPAGTFKCKYYRDSISFSNPYFQSYSVARKFYTSGVGLVKQTSEDFNVYGPPPYTPALGIYEELVSYSVK